MPDPTRWPLAVRPIRAGVFALALAGVTIPATPAEIPGLTPGLRVSVKGKLLPDGSLLADEIERVLREDDDEELRGLIASVDAASRTIRLMGYDVRVPEDAVLTREPSGDARFEDLEPGLRVKVDGRREGPGRFVAEKVRIRAKQYREARVVGPIESVSVSPAGVGTIEVVGLTVIVNSATDFLQFEGVAQPVVKQRIGVIDDEDVQLSGRYRIGKRIVFGGEFRFKVDHRSNPDLDPATDDGRLVPEFSGVVGMGVDLGSVFVFSELIGEREFFLDGGGVIDDPTEDRTRFRLGEVYFEVLRFPARNLSVAVGRQKFNESREWYYNKQNLDAVRLLASWPRWAVELSVSRDLFDESSNIRDQNKVNLIGNVRWTPTHDHEFEFYYIRRDDRTELAERPEWYGLRAMGDLGRHFEFWFDAAYQTGTRGEMPRTTGVVTIRDVEAYAYDAGVMLRPRWTLDPTLTLAYAMGSGEEDDAEGSDRTFRQTGLHRNKDRWNGVVSFRYYGEAIDPELTNIHIATAGFGLRPSRASSIDVIYHRYEQDAPSADLRGSNLDEDPEGLDTDLGHEWDLVLGYEPSRRVELRLKGGRFEPGPAFSRSFRGTTAVEFQAKFRF